MADRLFDRAFNKVLANQKLAEDQAEAQRPLSKEEIEGRELERLRTANTPMVVSDAIQRMLLAEKDKDYFRLLELPAPEVNALGRPAWSCTPTDISRAYRKLSAMVHPDKNSSQDARQAFEALNKAHRLLRDPGKLEETLNNHLAAAKRRQEAAEAAATPDERAALMATKRVEAQKLRKEEAEKYKAEVLQQQQRLQERAKRKREAQERAKRRELEDVDSDSEETAQEVKRQERESFPPARRKGKPKLIF